MLALGCALLVAPARADDTLRIAIFKSDSPQFEAAGSGLMRVRAGHGQLSQARSHDGRDHDDDARVLLSLHGGLYPVHLANFLRQGRPGLGQGRDRAAQRHRALPIGKRRVAAVGDACAERRLLEPGAQGQGRESAAADAGGK